MNSVLLALCGLLLICGIATASPFQQEESEIELVEPKIELNPECARGPVYWCQDLKVAKSCGAVRHCIQTVWEKQKYPVDNDSICKICLDMVKQARDQLESNETQADLKAVLEGSCNLIPIKTVRKECDKLADDFVPELIEALSSQMNPQVVCSVAGLCNNAAIDKMLIKVKLSFTKKFDAKPKQLSCGQCNKVSTIMADKFAHKNRDEILENMLYMCGRMSSLSDGCSSIVLTYFNNIYGHLKKSITSENICHMSGVCASNYHQHEEEIEVIADSQIGFVRPEDDDIPCDLCKQLITHLRDLLTANTTEAEFKQVLDGICKQTKSFKKECLSLADQYYDLIYAKLTKDLDPEGACFMIGICPKGFGNVLSISGPIIPLVPFEQSVPKKKVLGENEPKFSAQEIQNMQLPRDVLLLDASQIEKHVLKKNSEFCTLCEYFLHFVQDALASPKNEDEIREAVLKTCDRLPKSIQGECSSFVNTYGDAVVALLIQDLDPSQVCPKLNLCEARTSTKDEKCPLCLFLVQDAEELLQNNRTIENIKNKLNTLCNHLSDSLKVECLDFVQTYTNDLVDKLSNDFTPQEICLYLKLCTSNEEVVIESLGDKKSASSIQLPEIPTKNYIYKIEIDDEEDIEWSSPECLLCEQLVKKVEKKVENNKSKEHIREVLEEACSRFHRKSLKDKCVEIVEKNADYIVDAIIKEVTPKEICIALGFCLADEIQVPAKELTPALTSKLQDTPQCVLCELIMTKLEEELKNKKTQDEIEKTVKSICPKLPKSVSQKCEKFINEYADLIISLVSTVPPKELCGEINLCLTEQKKDLSRHEIVECAVCHAATEAVAKVIENNEEMERELIVEKACTLLPGKYYRPCNEFMEIYVESVVNLIKRSEKMSEICTKVGMCFSNGDNSLFVEIKDEMKDTDNSMELSKTKSSKCDLGPSYWCASPENMKECKVSHCDFIQQSPLFNFL